MKSSAEQILRIAPVIPVVTIHDANRATPLAQALLAGGLKIIEITMRTPAALKAISAIASTTPEICVGAGTVLTTADMSAATEAGAAFALSPGGTRRLLEAASEAPIPFVPGVATASEIMRGHELGYACFKYFPAEQAGGAAAIKSLAGPLPNARFCPTGGITPEKARAYLALENVLCVGGSWIAPPALIEAADWTQITSNARAAMALAPA